jgi:cytochrome c peroxidase
MKHDQCFFAALAFGLLLCCGCRSNGSRESAASTAARTAAAVPTPPVPAPRAGVPVPSAGSPWDRYEAGDKSAVSESAIRGHELFAGKAKCSTCHPTPQYTDGAVHDMGIGEKTKAGAPPTNFTAGPRGTFRAGASKVDAAPRGSLVRTPDLRSLSATGPYGHDGKEQSLDAMVRYMASGGKPVVVGHVLSAACADGICPEYGRDKRLDKDFIKIKLSNAEISDLAQFLKALNTKAPAKGPPVGP